MLFGRIKDQDSHFLIKDNKTQGSNPGLLHCRRMLYQLSHKGSPTSESRPHSILVRFSLSKKSHIGFTQVPCGLTVKSGDVRSFTVPNIGRISPPKQNDGIYYATALKTPKKH